MEIILKKDVEGLGLEFDTVNVKPGYARNFLIPNGFAFLATAKNKEKLTEILEARREEEDKLIKIAKGKIDQLKKVSLSITAKTGLSDRLFGSINNSDVAQELEKLGIKIEKKYIKIPGNTIKRSGNYTAKIRLHRNVEYEYEFSVVPEGDKGKSSSDQMKKEDAGNV